MVLTLSLNSMTMTAGFYSGDRRQVFRLSVHGDMTADDFVLRLSQLVQLPACGGPGPEAEPLEGAILASVAPRLTQAAAQAAHRLCGTRPYIIGPGLKTGIDIKINDPSQLGADLCAMAAGVAARHTLPAILVGISEATTVSYIDSRARYLGTVICPGLGPGLQSLVRSAELLNPVPLLAPRRALGTSTEESIRSGLIYGTAGLIDSMIARIRAEQPEGGGEALIATGGGAPAVIPHCREPLVPDEHLLTDGMYHIYQRQRVK